MKQVNNLKTLGAMLVEDLENVVKGRNGICKSCKNSTCKRDKLALRNKCNIYVGGK